MRLRNTYITLCGYAVALLVLVCKPVPLFGQQSSNSESEVYLTFQYKGVVSVYVTAYYKDGEFYLPINELFGTLSIDHNVDSGTLTVSGMYLGKTPYLIDFKNHVAKMGKKESPIQAEDFLIKELDYFLRAEVFRHLFGLNFSVDFSNLRLELKTQDKMPVVAEFEREQRWSRLERQTPDFEPSYYPLKFDRSLGTIDGGFLDYNLTTIFTPESELLTLSNSIGLEVLGGDLQGNTFGAFSPEQVAFTTQNLRWRFVQRNAPLFSSFTAGQTTSEGMTSRAITGFKISNKPVEPRLLFDRYVIEGEVIPQSEVELYLNNSLIDFQETDGSGSYRFIVPLTYGSTNYTIRIYTPSGRSFERANRIQVPFDYVPPGKIDYTLSAGRLENPILGTTERGYMGEASLSAGISQWLTAKISSEYLTNYHTRLPSFTGTLNACLFSNYLVSLNANSESFYRIYSSAIYRNGASWSLNYDYNPGSSRLYNIGGTEHQARLNLFTPFQVGNIPLNFRWSAIYQQQGQAQLVRYRADFNTRLGRLNVRLGYQDQQAGALDFIATSGSRITNSYTYTISRGSDVAGFLKGMFLRSQLTYLPGLDRFEEMEMQISREVARTGRIQLSYGRNFIGSFNTFSLNFTLDLNKFRSNTSARSSGPGYSFSQNFRGSVGFDPLERQLLLDNRQQVGQAGAAIRLFVDSNNDGRYQPESDNIISDPAIRLNRSGARTTIQNGINYISQLRPYQRYDIEINKGALSNPLLVPAVENFSFVTDPNQYKPIEIPFYLSGVISGRVERLQDSTRMGLSGVRLNLESQSDPQNPSGSVHQEEIRTFSDGSFYTYEVPPGQYSLYIDHTQLEFMDAISRPDTLEFRVRARAEGDFIEGLTFTVIPRTEMLTDPNPLLSEKLAAYEGYDYYVQIGSFVQKENAVRAQKIAEEQFGTEFIIAYNKATKLHAVRTRVISDRDQALAVLFSVISQQNESALVFTDERRSPNKEPMQAEFSTIQFGAFSTKEAAVRYAARVTRTAGKETVTVYDAKSKLYKVFLNVDPLHIHSQTLLHQLQDLKELRQFHNVFITKRTTTFSADEVESPANTPTKTIEYYAVQLGAFSTRSRADAFIQRAEPILDLQLEITYEQESNLYKVFSSVKPNSASLAVIKKQLQRIQRHPGFTNTFITKRIENIAVQPAIDLVEASTFTYEIHIQGVTPQAEQAFLSSVLGESTERPLMNRPSEDLVVFKDIKTWKEALELKEKLSKISAIGKPVIVLIKNKK